MPVFLADIQAKLSSSQLFRPTADVTEVNRRKLASNVQIIMLWAPSPARRRHAAGIYVNQALNTCVGMQYEDVQFW